MEDYVEQVWKLSMERLFVLEEENRYLRGGGHKVTDLTRPTDDSLPSDRYTTVVEEDEDDDSDIELQKCLYYGVKRKPKTLVNGARSSASTGTRLVSSRSTTSLSTNCQTHSASHTGATNVCDSLKLRASKSCWQMSDLGSSSSKLNTPTEKILPPVEFGDYDCERCESLHSEIENLKNELHDTREQLAQSEEKNQVLDKLNRCIEIENENFAYKVCSAHTIAKLYHKFNA